MFFEEIMIWYFAFNLLRADRRKGEIISSLGRNIMIKPPQKSIERPGIFKPNLQKENPNEGVEMHGIGNKEEEPVEKDKIKEEYHPEASNDKEEGLQHDNKDIKNAIEKEPSEIKSNQNMKHEGNIDDKRHVTFAGDIAKSDDKTQKPAIANPLVQEGHEITNVKEDKLVEGLSLSQNILKEQMSLIKISIRKCLTHIWIKCNLAKKIYIMLGRLLLSFTKSIIIIGIL